MNSLPTEIETLIWNMSGCYRDMFQPTLQKIRMWRVLQGIRVATHCMSCGTPFPVAFRGYVGQHCSKQCWKESFDDALTSELESIYEDGTYSLANSRYHQSYYSGFAKSGAVWPMGDPYRPCDNECIRTKKPIQIPGWNV